jgi:hypothetical protein
MRVPRPTLALAAIVTALGTLPATAVPAQASGPPLSFSIGRQLDLLAHGAAGGLPVSYVCSAARLFGSDFGYAIVTATTTQRVAGTANTGFDTGGPAAYLTCDGRSHHTQVLVASSPYAFRAGVPVHASVTVLACTSDESDCVQPEVERTVPALPAAASDPLDVPLGHATLTVDGTVIVALRDGCPPGSNVGLTLLQRTRGGQEADWLSETAQCRAGVTLLRVPTDSSLAPVFTRGVPAYADGSWEACDGTCRQGVVRGLVTVR